jgi:hypothetical protein
MVVLKSLLNLHDDCTWKIDEIADEFLTQHLRSSMLLEDYDDLRKFSRTGAPQDFPLNRVIGHIKKNPLNYLSNSEDKPFLLQDTVFSLREPFRKYWANDRFRSHFADRVNYALATYLDRKPGETLNSSRKPPWNRAPSG